ncbi:MAG: toll/interleukin-1 receptor domain-containing protein [Phycisphaerae bacterium]|nr:toll/interleukin-1 receptor domain-containing protein [Phycisphaerae bacterium]
MVANAKSTAKVFLSYSPADREIARTIQDRLADAGFKVLSAADSLPGENVLLEMGKALEDADALVVLLSPAAVETSNFTFELGYALASQRFAGRVIPVLLEETKNIPWILNRFQILRADENASRVSKAIIDRLNQHPKAASV